MNDLDNPEFFEQFKKEMLLIDQYAPLQLTLKRSEAFMLLSQLQLALRHPENTGPTADWARELGQTLEGAMSVSPAIGNVAQRGWSE